MTTHITDVTNSPAQNAGVSPDFTVNQSVPVSDNPSTALSVYQTPAPLTIFAKNMSEDEKVDLLTARQEYTGVSPEAFPINKPRRIVGCIYNIIDIPAHIVEETGEVVPRQRFEQALFKSDDLTDDDGNPRIYVTSSRLGLEFAANMIQACGQGDWTRSRTIKCNQEDRTGKDGKPRRMYRWQIVRGE